MKDRGMLTAAAWIDRAARLESELLHMVPARDRDQAAGLVDALIDATARAFAYWAQDRLEAKQ
jgi:hypothetical protein